LKDSAGAVVYLDEGNNMKLQMKIKAVCFTVICCSALGLGPVFGQPQAPRPAPPPAAPPPADFSARLNQIVDAASGKPAPQPTLTKFDLDFPGGTPKELVAAIQKALGRPLNAIIPEDFAATKLPALKMSSVDVSQLFQALTSASHKQEAVQTGPSTPYGSPNYQFMNTGFGFRQASDGRPTDDTIWYFYVERPAMLPYSPSLKVCHFYSLAPYLERGVTVDDITTAIETGWKMLGDAAPPKISFHKDTKLLIAVGEPGKLETIDAVLRALDGPTGGGGGGLVAPPMSLPNRPVKPAQTPR
jgi:hypothetical protein